MPVTFRPYIRVFVDSLPSPVLCRRNWQTATPNPPKKTNHRCRPWLDRHPSPKSLPFASYLTRSTDDVTRDLPPSPDPARQTTWTDCFRAFESGRSTRPGRPTTALTGGRPCLLPQPSPGCLLGCLAQGWHRLFHHWLSNSQFFFFFFFFLTQPCCMYGSPKPNFTIAVLCLSPAIVARRRTVPPPCPAFQTPSKALDLTM